MIANALTKVLMVRASSALLVVTAFGLYYADSEALRS
jgi:hypothetical protein